MEYDSDRLLRNINTLVEERGMKIGDFETAMLVSTGYISRTFKKEDAKPNLHFLVNVAKYFEISLDDLLFKELSASSANEDKISGFLSKLIDDTWKAKLYWKPETPEDLNDRVYFSEYEDDCSHPLFSHIVVDRDGVTKDAAVFLSRTFGSNTTINGNCYKLKLDTRAELYIMNICEYTSSAEKPLQAKEMWMDVYNSEPQFLCDDKARNGIGQKLTELYAVIRRAENCPKATDEVDSIIDTYMTDLPFQI